jgi:hypothetical protein
VGALFTDASSSIEGNRVVGADLKWRLTPTQRIEGFALLSRTHTIAGDATRSGGGAQVNYSFETNKWVVLASAEHYDRGFDMATAFINRVGITGAWTYLNRSFYPDKKRYPWVRRISVISFNKGGEDRNAGGAEFYSLICDTVVAPTWHPPAPEDFQELAAEVRRLNQHLLFETPDDALSFKSYYTSKPWAETEDFEGAFKTVRVDDV